MITGLEFLNLLSSEAYFSTVARISYLVLGGNMEIKIMISYDFEQLIFINYVVL
jgi:hypothetical protein